MNYDKKYFYALRFLHLHSGNLHAGVIILRAVVGTRDHGTLGVGIGCGIPASTSNVSSSDIPQGLENRGL